MNLPSRHLSRLVALCFLVAIGVRAAEKPRILFIAGEYEYKSLQTFPAFAKELEENYPVRCTVLKRPADSKLQTIDGLENLEKADIAVLMIRRMTLPEDQLGKIQTYVKAGKPLVGLRTASHAFENWKGFDHDVLGGNYGNHHDNNLATSVRLATEASSHPILKGIVNFTSPGSLYRNTPLASTATPLLIGSVSNQKEEPVAWVNAPGGARVFYTSLGHPADFGQDNFKQLLVNAIFWGLNRPVPIAVPAGAPQRVGVELFEQVWRANSPVVLDVRTPKEFAAGHIPGAVNMDVNAPDFEKRVGALDKNETYLVHCAGGVRSARACGKLAQMEFKRLLDLAPGFQGWLKAGKTVEK